RIPMSQCDASEDDAGPFASHGSAEAAVGEDGIAQNRVAYGGKYDAGRSVAPGDKNIHAGKIVRGDDVAGAAKGATDGVMRGPLTEGNSNTLGPLRKVAGVDRQSRANLIALHCISRRVWARNVDAEGNITRNEVACTGR